VSSQGIPPLLLAGFSAYAAQAEAGKCIASRTDDARPPSPPTTALAVRESPPPAAGEAERARGFGFRLGKLSVSVETEEPALDVGTIARVALERFDRVNKDAFSSELEIAQLRESLAPQTEISADLEQQGPTLPPRQGARLYAEAESSQFYAQFRPGTLLGVI